MTAGDAVMIDLEAGAWRARIAPEIGGAVWSLNHAGRPVLRPTPQGAAAPLETACFPLVPYANRIDQGRFAFDGRRFDVGATPGFEPHALHGVGWRAPWRTEAAGADHAVLALDHPGDKQWPWTFTAEQRFSLDERGLTITLTLVNRAETAAPGGVGLHPYFHRAPGARLKLKADRVWMSDETLIPRRLAPSSDLTDWSAGQAIETAPFVDNAYEGWDGRAEIRDEAGGAVLTAPGVERVHVYAPPGQDFVCMEPVSHRPDALNASEGAASGLRVLAPGERMNLAMTIGV